MKAVYLAIITAIGLCGLISTSVLAVQTEHSLKIQPLLYREDIKSSEQKKGYVDIANPNSFPVTVDLKVKAFEQINNEGALRFFEDEQISAGILLDLDSAELQPKDVLRLYFLVDGKKLPPGDVFGAILASVRKAEGEKTSSVVSAQVGTLVMVTNGTPSSRNATIDELSASRLQIGEAIHSTMLIRNTAPSGRATGFFPTVRVDLTPYSSKEVTGPLIFAGRVRQVEYRQPGDYFGPILLKAKIGKSERSRVVFAITGYWRWLAPLIGVVVSLVVVAWAYRVRHSRVARRRQTTRR